MKNILVLCTGNSCRSQIAHGYLAHLISDATIKIYSAGIEPLGVNLRAISTMREDNIDVSHYTSNHISEYENIVFDFVITVCDNAKEQCPIYLSDTTNLHYNFIDPAKARGNEIEIEEQFRIVREEIKQFCINFIAQNLNKNLLVEAIILAGGFGTRLKSVIAENPKCLALVNGQEFLMYLIKKLHKQNIQKIILSLGYKHEMIINFINQKVIPVYPKLNIEYVIETEALGTGGGIMLAMQQATKKDVLILNGDTFLEMDYQVFYQTHKNNNANCSIALKQMTNFDRYGSVHIDADLSIIKFEEKKYCAEGFINGGIYLLNKTKFLEQNLLNKFSFEKDYLEKKISNEKIYGILQNGYFIDIGIPDDYFKAQEDFKYL